MIVMKFGGTSLRGGAEIERVAELVRERLPQSPVLVVSAHAGVTDELDRLAGEARDHSVDMETLWSRHTAILGELDLPTDLVDDLLEELASLLEGVSLVQELTRRSRDYVLSFGELLSARIVAATLRKKGIPAKALPAWDLGLVTDSSFGSAHPLPETHSRLKRSLAEVKDVPVVTGFVAQDREGNVTTLGRSGSDYTASLIGAAVGADEIQIWTDVDGVMSADPRIVPEARSLPQLSFQEMSELAYYGAKVIHPATMIPAVEQSIPVRVLNTNRPEHPGTVITEESDADATPVRSIAYRRRLTVVNVVSTRMLLQHGFMARLFEIFARHEVVVDMISTSEVSVSITTDSTQDLSPVVKELTAFADVDLEAKKAILCLVGEGLRTSPDTTARTFKTLCDAGVPTRMISMGATKVNLSLLIAEADVERAVRALHREFFGPSGPDQSSR